MRSWFCGLGTDDRRLTMTTEREKENISTFTWNSTQNLLRYTRGVDARIHSSNTCQRTIIADQPHGAWLTSKRVLQGRGKRPHHTTLETQKCARDVAEPDQRQGHERNKPYISSLPIQQLASIDQSAYAFGFVDVDAVFKNGNTLFADTKCLSAINHCSHGHVHTAVHYTSRHSTWSKMHGFKSEQYKTVPTNAKRRLPLLIDCSAQGPQGALPAVIPDLEIHLVELITSLYP